MKILIATDGSDFSRRAFERAAELAATWKDVAFRVIAVYEPQVPAAPDPYALLPESFEELDAIGHDRAEADAKACVDFLKQTLGESVKIDSTVQIGRPVQAILEEAESWGADLIVVGSHGHGFWGRLAIGSVSDAVMRHAPCSVLIVR